MKRKGIMTMASEPTQANTIVRGQMSKVITVKMVKQMITRATAKLVTVIAVIVLQV